MAYIYRHIRLDKNEPFYIGIGSDSSYSRSISIKNRNNHWKNIVSLSKYKIDILMNDITWEDACVKEQEFIKLYGRSDLGLGTLCNMTDGGEGPKGFKFSIEQCNNLSKLRKGKKPSEECYKQAKIKNTGTGNCNYKKPLPDWQKEINRKTQLGRKHSKTTIELRVSQFRKKVINTITGEIFPSISSVALKYNMPCNTTTRWINAGKLNLKFL